MSNWSWSKDGQNFSVPLHDNNRQYRTITTGLVKVQPDQCGEGLANGARGIADPTFDASFPTMLANATCQSVNGCALSQGANRTYNIGVGKYFLETQMTTFLGACSDFNVKLVCSGGAKTASPTDSDPLGFSVDVFANQQDGHDHPAPTLHQLYSACV